MNDSSSRPAPPARSVVQYIWRAVPYALLVLVVYLMWAPRRSGPEQGSAAATFDLPVLVGSRDRVRLDELRGQPVLIEVFASWCSSCRSSVGTFRDVVHARRERPMHFVAVSVDDSREAGSAAARTWDFGCDVAYDDGQFSRDYGIAVLPTLILLDADGRVHRVSAGAVGRNKLESWLTEVGAKRR